MRLMMERMTTRMTTPWLDDSPRGRASSYCTVLYSFIHLYRNTVPYRCVEIYIDK